MWVNFNIILHIADGLIQKWIKTEKKVKLAEVGNEWIET